MTGYRVFLGAPSRKNIYVDLDARQRDTYCWHMVAPAELPVVPVPATLDLETVSRRISRLYENIIFSDDGEEIDYPPSPLHDELQDDAAGKTTFITWPPTQAPVTDSTRERRVRKSTISFLDVSISISRTRGMQETQGTQDTHSYDYSDASSIARFPEFHFTLHGVTSLSDLQLRVPGRAPQCEQQGGRKVSVLVAILEVEGPDVIRVKKGMDAGKEVSVLKFILGDDDGNVCKVTAWREVAESWGGSDPDPSAPALKRGDVVLLENILISSDPTNGSHVSLTASPLLRSRAELCFRTLPNSPEDACFRPDLRLGFSDSAVRRVAALVSWFESIAGLC